MDEQPKIFNPEDVELALLRQGLNDTASLVGRLANSRNRALKTETGTPAGIAFNYTDDVSQDIANCLSMLELRIAALESARDS